MTNNNSIHDVLLQGVFILMHHASFHINTHIHHNITSFSYSLKPPQLPIGRPHTPPLRHHVTHFLRHRPLHSLPRHVRVSTTQGGVKMRTSVRQTTSRAGSRSTTWPASVVIERVQSASRGGATSICVGGDCWEDVSEGKRER